MVDDEEREGLGFEEANSGIEGGDLLYQMLVWNLYRMPIVRPITVPAQPKIPLLGLDPGV